MGAVQHGVPIELVTALVDACELTVAVETGTFRGDSTAELDGLVGQVWTVEADDQFYSSATHRFRDSPTISVVHGNSETGLTTLLAKVDGPAIFWLDAHALPSNIIHTTVDQEAPCPVEAELIALRGFPHINDSCVLIDDARLFFGPHPAYIHQNWPRFTSLATTLGAMGLTYVTALDDVIIAVPEKMGYVVDSWWLARMQERNGEEFHKFLCKRLREPSTSTAMKLLAQSLLPQHLAEQLRRWRVPQRLVR